MLNFTLGQSAWVVVTLKEKETLVGPNFLFRFVHRTSNLEVKFVLLQADNDSEYKDRFDRYYLDINLYFENKPIGEWEYYIYEQLSPTNTNVNLTTSMVESGIMNLKASTDFAYNEYNPNNNFIVR